MHNFWEPDPLYIWKLIVMLDWITNFLEGFIEPYNKGDSITTKKPGVSVVYKKCPGEIN